MMPETGGVDSPTLACRRAPQISPRPRSATKPLSLRQVRRPTDDTNRALFQVQKPKTAYEF
jgi:hypothetical protein